MKGTIKQRFEEKNAKSPKLKESAFQAEKPLTHAKSDASCCASILLE